MKTAKQSEMTERVKTYLRGKVVVAPLAGYSDSVYRRIMREMGASPVFTEMISARGLIRHNRQTMEYLSASAEEHPLAVQLFGSDAEEIAEAAKIVFQSGIAEILDINMGCPVKKVLKQGAGAALLSDPEKIAGIVRAVAEISPIPVSCKIRAGKDSDHIDVAATARIIEQAGASMITIHGRTEKDLYRGRVNLDYIKAVKDAVSVPVIGNGDIRSVADAERMIEITGCDAVMVGRASVGNPWLIRDLVYHFGRKPLLPPPSVFERMAMLRRHFRESVIDKGERIALLQMRSFSVRYLKGIPGMKEFKTALIKAESGEEWLRLTENPKGGKYENGNDECPRQ